jgi:(E)-4-hydroxy-3-methylbut-2-enyl-diphosphate synthase
MADVSQLNIIDKKQLRAIGHHYLPEPDKWHLDDQGADYVYSGNRILPFMVANGSRVIYSYQTWLTQHSVQNCFPAFTLDEVKSDGIQFHPEANFLWMKAEELSPSRVEIIRKLGNFILILHTTNEHAMASLRKGFVVLMEEKINLPVVVFRSYNESEESNLQLFASTDVGGLLVDGQGDGIMLNWQKINDVDKNQNEMRTVNQLAFGILQAARTRMSKTEYISCPSCGRTLFDLQETTAMIRKRTDHLKGVKIGIMGCIVNGPGEMADADYGYVGVGKDKIALYRGQNVVKKSVPAGQAVDELIELIREDGIWFEPSEAFSAAAY